MTEQNEMGMAYDPDAQTAHQNLKKYQTSQGEGTLEVWSVLILLLAFLGGCAWVIEFNRFGSVEFNPAGLPLGVATLLSGMVTSAVLRGLSGIIGLLKEISAALHGDQAHAGSNGQPSPVMPR